jgi:hypothetical protein
LLHLAPLLRASLAQRQPFASTLQAPPPAAALWLLLHRPPHLLPRLLSRLLPRLLSRLMPHLLPRLMPRLLPSHSFTLR